jgi:hypothetical protein
LISAPSTANSSSVAPEDSLPKFLIFHHLPLPDNPVAHDARRRHASAYDELPAVVRHHVCRKGDLEDVGAAVAEGIFEMRREVSFQNVSSGIFKLFAGTTAAVGTSPSGY